MPLKREAWSVTRYGGPDVLAPVTCQLPVLHDDEVLIRVRASAVSRADTMMRSGTPRFARLFLGLRRPRAGLSGTCFSGEVVATGRDVSHFRVGDAVFGEAGMRFGANSSHIAVREAGSLVGKPDGLTHAEAATLFDGAVTSWHFMAELAQVGPGMRVLILGGSGSLGSAAIQFAKARGAHVTATSSARNSPLLRSLGADVAIGYAAGLDGIAGPFDTVFDTLGVSSLSAMRPVLAKDGLYLCPVLGLRLLRDMAMNRWRRGPRARFAAVGLEAPEVHRNHCTRILDLARTGQFTPLMDRTYPLADLVEAHRYVGSGRKRGNVVVV